MKLVDLEVCVLDGGDDLRFGFENSGIMPATRNRLFDVLAAPEPWPQWFPSITQVTYLTDKPFQVGSERDVTTKAGTIREQFLAWDRGERFCFYARQSSMPAITRFMEDYLISDAGPDPRTGEDRSSLTWRVHYDLAAWAAWLHPLARSRVKSTFADGVASLADWLERNPERPVG